MAELGSPRYVRFTTFRRSGEPVSVPVWFAPMGGEWVFGTDLKSGKVKRLRNWPVVEIAAANVRGKVRPGTPVFDGTVRFIEGEARTPCIDAIAAKYGYQWSFFALCFKVGEFFGRPFDSPYLAVTLGDVVRFEGETAAHA